MKKTTFLLLLIMGFGGMMLATAASALDCNNAMTQADMNACSAKDAKTAEDELNAVYTQLSKGLGGEDREQLKTVEKLWLAYREKECAFEAQDNAGGSMYPLELNSCYAGITQIRIKELQDTKKIKGL